jgi:peptidyl-prolyl cis-trans isomerase SurA
LKNREALIQHLIGEKILDSEVRRRGLEITVEQVEKEIRGIARQNGITRNQLKSALQERGISYSDYQDFIRTTKQRQQVIELEVSSKIKISDEDIAAYYTKTKGGTEVYEYKLAHILFLNRNGGPEQAKKRAEATLSKVGKSLSFEALAKEYSEDTNFTKGGVLGTFRSGELSPEMEAAARNLSVGDTSGVVSSRVGYHIIKLLDKKLIVDPELEEEKPKLRALLFSEAFKKQFTNWLAQKRDDAFIKLN